MNTPTAQTVIQNLEAELAKLQAVRAQFMESMPAAVERAAQLARTDRYAVAPWLAEGKSGAYFIDRCEIGTMEAMFETIRAYKSGLCRVMVPGTITRLVELTGNPDKPSIVWMSDTADEWRDHAEAVDRAHGEVLVHGLGIGMVAAAMLKKDSVTRLTVIERNPHIIALVEPYLRAAPFVGAQARLRIIEADAYEWMDAEGTFFDVVWSDIWPNISTENCRGYAKLRLKFRGHARWHGCWVEKESVERDRLFRVLEEIKVVMHDATPSEREALRAVGTQVLQHIGAL